MRAAETLEGLNRRSSTAKYNIPRKIFCVSPAYASLLLRDGGIINRAHLFVRHGTLRRSVAAPDVGTRVHFPVRARGNENIRFPRSAPPSRTASHLPPLNRFFAHPFLRRGLYCRAVIKNVYRRLLVRDKTGLSRDREASASANIMFRGG